jgi:hypothetical protein
MGVDNNIWKNAKTCAQTKTARNNMTFSSKNLGAVETAREHPTKATERECHHVIGVLSKRRGIAKLLRAKAFNDRNIKDGFVIMNS